MDIYKPGSYVKLGSQIVMIIEACIKQTDVVYRVIWWSEGRRNDEWISALEIDNDLDAAKLTIGFK